MAGTLWGILWTTAPGVGTNTEKCLCRLGLALPVQMGTELCRLGTGGLSRFLRRSGRLTQGHAVRRLSNTIPAATMPAASKNDSDSDSPNSAQPRQTDKSGVRKENDATVAAG